MGWTGKSGLDSISSVLSFLWNIRMGWTVGISVDKWENLGCSASVLSFQEYTRMGWTVRLWVEWVTMDSISSVHSFLWNIRMGWTVGIGVEWTHGTVWDVRLLSFPSKSTLGWDGQ